MSIISTLFGRSKKMKTQQENGYNSNCCCWFSGVNFLVDVHSIDITQTAGLVLVGWFQLNISLTAGVCCLWSFIIFLAIILPGSASVRGQKPVRPSLVSPNIGSVETFFQDVGFGARSKWSEVFAFSFLYYSPDISRRSLWTLLGLLKMLVLFKSVVSNNCSDVQQRAKVLAL